MIGSKKRTKSILVRLAGVRLYASHRSRAHNQHTARRWGRRRGKEIGFQGPRHHSPGTSLDGTFIDGARRRRHGTGSGITLEGTTFTVFDSSTGLWHKQETALPTDGPPAGCARP